MNLQFLNTINPFYILSKRPRAWHEDLILYVYLVFFLYILVKLILRWIDRYSPIKEEEENHIDKTYNRRKIARRIFIFLAIFFAFPVFYHRLDYIPTLLGFSSAAIIISLKEVTFNIVGWFIIQGTQGFRVGDRIEIDGVKGDVININIMRFTLLEVSKEHTIDQSTNRMIHLPNNLIVLQKVFHVSQKMEYVWDELNLYFSIDSDIEKLDTVLAELLTKSIPPADIQTNVKEISRNFLMRMGKTTPIVYLTIDNNKILASLRYLTHIKQKRQNKSFLSKQILKTLQNEVGIRLT